MNADPFTGGGSYTPSAAPAAAPAAAPGGARPLAYCPVRACVYFESTPAGLEACLKKLREFNAALLGAADAGALGTDEDATLGALVAALAPGAGAAAGAVPPGAAQLLGKLLSWQEGHLFPVLDLCRAAALRADAAAALLAAGAGGDSAPGEALAAALLRVAAASAGGAAPGAAPAVTTALRCAANAFATPAGRAWASAARDMLLDAFAGAPGAASKPARAAFTTLLLNCAVDAAAPGAPAAARAACVAACVAAAAAVPCDDDDAAFRALAALGTLAAADGAAADAARQLGGADVAGAAAARGGSPGAKAPAAAQDVLDILKQR